MSIITDFKNELMELLQDITLDDGTTIQAVLDSSEDWTKAYPIIRVLPDTVDTETIQTKQYQRAYSLAVLVDIFADEEGEAYNMMYDLVEAIQDRINEADSNQGFKAYPALFVNTAFANFGIDSKNNGVNIEAQITVTIAYSKNF